MANIYVRSTDGSDSDNGSTWALAKATLNGAAGVDAAGDTVYVSDNHAESTAGAISITWAGTASAPMRILCVDDTGDPTSPTTLATSATVSTSGANSITLNGNAYTYGIKFTAGDGTSSAGFLFLTNTAGQIYENCDFICGGSGTGSRIGIPNGSGDGGVLRWKNCNVKFANASQHLNAVGGDFFWDGGSLLAGGTSPAVLVSSSIGNSAAKAEISGVDLSAADAGMHLCSLNGYRVVFRNCRLPSGWTGSLCSGTPGAGFRGEMYNCDDGATNYRLWIEDYTGSIKHDSGVYLTAHRDAGTPISHKFVSSANCNFASGRLYGPEIHAVITSTMVGVSQTAAVEVVLDSATAINDDEIWLEVMYPSSTTTTLGAWASDAKTNILASGTAQASSSAAWTGTGGFANVQKRKLTVAFTPQMEGILVARVVMGKASTTVYVDPDVTIAAT